jgi:hypothetical protein
MSMICYVGQVSDQDLQKIKEDPTQVELLLDAAEQNCDLDKSWHALHYILNGDAWDGEFPLNFLASGGEEIGEDMGYGPARFLNAAETQILKTELDKITVADFENKFDPQALTTSEIYPAIDWADDTRPWLTDSYKSIKDYIEDAVTSKKGIYIYLT